MRSASHRSSGDRPAAKAGDYGFSLVEVLVTLSITALASAMIVATARPAEPLRTEGERLSRTLEQLEARARVSGKPMGLLLEPEGYTGVTWQDGAWKPFAGGRHNLTGGVEIRAAPGIADPSSDEDGGTPARTLVFDPLGHSDIAPVILQARGREFVVSFPPQSPVSAP